MATQSKPLPDQQALLRALDYDPDTGFFTWKKRDDVNSWWNTSWALKPAFYVKHIAGYRCGQFNGSGYLAHRIAWKMIYGDEPAEIDHINGDRSDNRICNLRASDKTRNGRNKAYRSNTSGVYGVSLHKASGLWFASITVSGVRKSLGYYKNLEDAKNAREQGKAKYGFDPEHGIRKPYSG